MAKLQNVIFSENQQENFNSDRPITTVYNPDYIFRPDFIPGNFSFAINIIISGVDAKEKNQSFRFIFTDPDGEIFNDSGEMPIAITNQVELNVSKLPDEARGARISLDFRNAVFKKEGRYIMEVYYQREHIGSQDLFIYKKDDTENE
ncbi:hypothetical protein D3Y79_02195 [Listeria monocytogenes]|nr:hypothetical protein [Listeria monocytogenes]